MPYAEPRIRKLARDHNLDRGRLINYYQRKDLTGDDDKEIQDSMGDRKRLYAVMDAIGYQEGNQQG